MGVRHRGRARLIARNVCNGAKRMSNSLVRFDESGDVEFVSQEHVGGLAQRFAVQPNFGKRCKTVESENEAFAKALPGEHRNVGDTTTLRHRMPAAEDQESTGLHLAMRTRQCRGRRRVTNAYRAMRLGDWLPGCSAAILPLVGKQLPSMAAAAADAPVHGRLLRAVLAVSHAEVNSSKLADASSARLALTARAIFKTSDLHTVEVWRNAAAAWASRPSGLPSSHRRYSADSSAAAPSWRNVPNTQA